MDNKPHDNKTHSHSCCTPKKSSKTTPILIAIVIIGLAAFVYFKSGSAISFLPFLGILACPLIMFFGMKGMHGNNGGSDDADKSL